MSSKFSVCVMSNVDEKDKFKYMVVEDGTGWFYPNLTLSQAKFLCDKFNEVVW